MKKYTHVSIFYAFLLLALILNSCLNGNDEVLAPDYWGTWERKWVDDNSEGQYIQILQIKKDKFTSTIEIEKDNRINKYIEFEGKYVTIDMTFEVWIENISISGQDNEIEY